MYKPTINIGMYEWIEREISEIKTPRFHVVDGPADAELRRLIEQSSLALPQAYKEFVIKFGNAKLYRKSRNDSYRIGVFAGPRETILKDGITIYHLGFHDGASVYVKRGFNGATFSIFEFEEDTEEKVADDFEEWLKTSCARARDSYDAEEWAEILHGPKPFTDEEEEIVETRRRIQWQIIGIDPKGDHIFKVTNGGRRKLDVLTIGVRSKNGRLHGALNLKIGKVGPGETAIIHAGCYKGLVPSQDLEIFQLPDPEPGDQERYGEFGAE